MIKLSFRTRLLLGFVLLVVIMGAVSTFAGISFISQTVTKEAMLRVEFDLESAWTAYSEEEGRIQMAVSLSSQNEIVRELLRSPSAIDSPGRDLEALRRRQDLDFLSLIDAKGIVLARGRFPYATGDTVAGNPIVDRALKGSATAGTVLIPRDELRLEAEELAVRAFIPLVYTERAVPTDRDVEDQGMVIETAIPILDAKDRVQGVLYGGILLNRNFGLVDRIRDVAFGDKTFQGKPVGTVTFFLGDVRVATNVLLDAGTRALGTRVSEEVYERVLDRGERWADRAFVVNEWYLSAYDPIQDPTGRIVGIIYVGLLEKKYLEYSSTLAMRYLGISFLTLLVSIGLALYLSGIYRKPIQKLIDANRELSAGNLQVRAEELHPSPEMMELACSFNAMAAKLEADTNRLQQASVELKEAYEEAEDRNQAYLEMLGFVTHELKSPLASIVFAIASLRDHILGPLNREQEALLKAAANSADYLHGTIVNYLNLSRIEEGRLNLRLSEVTVYEEIVAPLIEQLSELAAERKMRIECHAATEVKVVCDKNLISSVFQNLLSNAIKYGKDGGEISIDCSRTANPEIFRFSVWNEGEGFDPDDTDKLFQKFFRLGEGKGATKPGTGLGLFVARQVIGLHGGRIWAESKPGNWARFSFTLPIEPSGAQGMETWRGKPQES